MSEPHDHFIALVERLGAALEASPARVEQLAADAEMSRLHFERLVTAVAGESPTRLRVRILLERAAYRLLTGDEAIRKIAATSGFSSYAAFIHAFRREYGENPSVWRANPTGFRIDSSNDVHFHPPAGLRLPARHRTDSVDLVHEMVAHHVWLTDELVRRAALVGDADLDEPHDRTADGIDGIDGETLRWSLSRLIGQMETWNAAVHETDYDVSVEEHESVPSMQRRVARVGPEFVDNVALLSAQGRFDETFAEAFSPTPRVLSYAAMLAQVLTFAAHHRVLALARLRACGITDLGLDDPTTWFASAQSRSSGPGPS